MPLQSLRDYLQAVEAHGDLLQIDGADREEEIGALAEIVASTPGHPLVLFDKIKGFPSGFRVSASTMGGIRRMALGLGLDPALSNIDLVRAWMERKLVVPYRSPESKAYDGSMIGRDGEWIAYHTNSYVLGGCWERCSPRSPPASARGRIGICTKR